MHFTWLIEGCYHFDGQSSREKSGAPNDSFLSDPSKRYLRLSRVPLKLCGFISGRTIIFLSVPGELESFRNY